MKKMAQGRKYTKENIISELKRFNEEYSRIPNQQDFEKPPKGYPSRKTFTTLFGSFNNALRESGFDIKDKPEYTREYLISEIYRYIEEYGKQPNVSDIDSTKGFPTKNVYRKVFGSWNNLIKELGLVVRVSQYSEQELDNAFFSFVKEYSRPPTFREFNTDSRYPSFWCYQNRFGSWNKTLIHYGFPPNEGSAGTYNTFSNGEVCKSTYEFDVSTWLRSNGISYIRNMPYKDFVNEYDGRKDCDYVIFHRGEFIWLEIAGLYSSRENKSGMERGYIKAFDHKLNNLLNQFNYKVLYPDDFKKINYEETFSFLNEIESRPWFEGESIYQGMVDEYGEAVY